MFKKKWLTGLLALLCLISAAFAQADCTFPDLGYLLETEVIPGPKSYVFSADFTCDAYYWDYPPAWNEKHNLYIPLLPLLHGWTSQAALVDGYDGYELTGPQGERALLVPQFGGRLLLLLPVGCRLVPADPNDVTPEPTAVPTPAPRPDPTAAPANNQSSGHWEWQTKTVDCPFCYGGRCKTCGGTGVYRMYGVSVDCDPDCAACDGVGTYEENNYVYIPGY